MLDCKSQLLVCCDLEVDSLQHGACLQKGLELSGQFRNE